MGKLDPNSSEQLSCTHDCMHCINVHYEFGHMVGTCDNPNSPFYNQQVSDTQACGQMDEGNN
jgi:hypothetical protein